MVTVSGYASPGVCDICGQPIEACAAFVNIGPTDRTDPSRPRTRRWVPARTDIHGWTPFALDHPHCFAEVNGQGAPDRSMAQTP